MREKEDTGLASGDLVTVITPVFNAEFYMSATIESVIAQTYENWEMIIVDDSSADNSVEIAASYASRDNRVHLVELDANSGAARARNVGIEQARGRYIAFIDSDDLWKPSKLEKQVAFMRKSGSALSYGAYDVIDATGQTKAKFVPPETLTYTDLLKTNSIGCLTAMYDTKQLGKVLMPLVRRRQDLGLWLKILKRIPEARGLDEPLAQYRVHSDSMSADKWKSAMAQWVIYRQVEKLNLFQSLRYFVLYAINGFLKYKK